MPGKGRPKKPKAELKECRISGFAIPADLADRLKEAAEDQERTQRDIIRRAIKLYLAENGY